jgi:hypothetical protein
LDVVTYHAKRRTQLVVVAFGLTMLVLGAAIIAPRLGGWVAVAIGAVATIGGLCAFVPGAAYVRVAGHVRHDERRQPVPGRRVGQRLDETRSYVGNFTTATGDELAAKAGAYLARSAA